MNWPEFKLECEKTMLDKGIDPEKVIVRVEVSDSYYDRDVTPDRIHISHYENELPILVIFGH